MALLGKESMDHDTIQTIFGAVCAAALFMFILGVGMRCPNCTKWWARRHVKKDDHRTWRSTKIITEKLSVKNPSGKDTGNYVEQKREVAVHYEEFKMLCVCRHCRHTWHGPRVTQEI